MGEATTSAAPTLAGEHAFVTGAGSGIGAAIARALIAAGARVTLAGRRLEPLQALQGELGAGAKAVVLDVTVPATITAAVTSAESAQGPVTILVNNAGQASSAPFEKTDMALWSRMLEVNLTGVYAVTHAVLPRMTARRRGRVINVASTAGLIGYPYVAAYVAAKHGVIGLTRALAQEVAKRGVTVNAVCPGFTETPLLEEAVANIVAKTARSEAEARADLAKGNPQGRLVRPEEVADAVLWLASPGAASINGQAIAVAGGEVMTG